MTEQVFSFVQKLNLPNDPVVPSHESLISDLKNLAQAHSQKIKVDLSGRSRKGKELAGPGKTQFLDEV
ncbi:MAG: hypothetical protein AABZ06_12620 [Bdellovibrionota bacterium]